MTRLLYIFLTPVLLCACLQGGSTNGSAVPVPPVSELCIQRLNNNYLPLSCCDTEQVGDAVQYRFHAKDCLCTSGAIFICHDPADWEVTVNGRQMQLVEGLHQLGAGDGCFVLGDLLQPGENIVELSRSSVNAGTEAPSAFIAGDFDVVPCDDGGWSLMPARVLETGSWDAQGMPFYGWEVSYSRGYNFPDKAGDRILRLGEWKGRVCEVWINWERAGEIKPGKHEMHIGRFLKGGRNEIEVRCTGSTDRLYGQPGTNDCGLYEEFTIE